MRAEDVRLGDAPPDAFVEKPHSGFIAVWPPEPSGGISYQCYLAPGLSAEQEWTAREWFASLLSHLEEHDFAAAIEMDGWFSRSDGGWQQWGRPVLLPPDPF